MADKQKSVMITGAGTGIGLATAERFLQEGWNVLAVGRREAPLHLLTKAHPGRVTALPCDLTSPDSVNALCAQIMSDPAHANSLEALINNAGAYERRSLENSDDAHWSLMIEANLLGPVRLSRGLLSLLTKNHGVVVNVSSTLGLKPVAQTGAYSAAKAALVNWLKPSLLNLPPAVPGPTAFALGSSIRPYIRFTPRIPKPKLEHLKAWPRSSPSDGLEDPATLHTPFGHSRLRVRSG